MSQQTENPGSEVEALKSRLAQLQARNAELEKVPPGALPAWMEVTVREKMRAGLTREQALEAVNSQIAWDKDPANSNCKRN